MNYKRLIKPLFFYWISSFLIASIGYYLLLFLLKQDVFGSAMFMRGYHDDHPLQYILIPCFIYGIIAISLGKKHRTASIGKQLIWTGVVILGTIALSSPLGGILWYFHDMQAGYFPTNWLSRMIEQGTFGGIRLGAFIIIGSFPYNLLGCVVCFFLTRMGNRLFLNPKAVS